MSDELELDATESTQPVVRYTAKELFSQINKKLDIVLELAQTKASQEDHEALELVVENHDRRIQTLEDEHKGNERIIKLVAWTLGFALTASAVITGIIVEIIHLFAHHHP